MKPYIYYRSGVAYARIFVPVRLKHLISSRYLIHRLGCCTRGVARLRAELFVQAVQEGVQKAMVKDIKLSHVIIEAGGITVDTARPQDFQDLKDLGLHDEFLGAVSSKLKRERVLNEQPHPMKNHEPYAIPAPEKVYTLKEVIDAFLKVQRLNVEERDYQKLCFDLEKFLPSLLDVSIPTHLLTTHMLHDFRNTYLKRIPQLPVNIDKLSEFKKYVVGERCLGMKFLWQAIDDGQHKKYKNQAPRTMDHHVQSVQKFWDWAINEGIYSLTKSPLDGVKSFYNKNDTTDTRTIDKRAFSLVELQKIFSESIIFGFTTECRFWLQMIGLHCGCRVDEIAGLPLEDVFTEFDTLCIRIAPNASLGRRTKNFSSRRSFPVPQVLLDYGFEAYVERLRTTKQPYLFPMYYSAEYKFGKEAGRQFNRLLRSKQVNIKDPEVTFHSFRHNLTNAMAQAGLDDRTIADISGHTADKLNNTLNKVYITAQRVDILKVALDKVHYDGLIIPNPYIVAQGVVKNWLIVEKEFIQKNLKALNTPRVILDD